MTDTQIAASLDLSPVDLAWAAGFFDGEGYIGLFHPRDKRHWWLRITVTNSDPRALAKFQAMFGVGTIRCDPRQSPRHLDRYMWSATSKNAGHVLALIRPYLVIKREQADVAMESRALMVNNRRANPNFGRFRELDQMLRNLKRLPRAQ